MESLQKLKEIQFSKFLMGGVASVGATIVTNPIEVIKTRLQLQGELAKRGTYTEKYRGTIHGFIQVAKHDGIRGLQKGLSAALGFQFTINFFRLGIYDSATGFGWTKAKNGNDGVGGCVGSCAGSPFFLVKTQLQSFTKSEIAVGYQREHNGLIHAFRTIYKSNGIRGLYRGVVGNIPRAFLGSGAQLATFGPTKDFLYRNNLNFSNPTCNSFLCGLIAGSMMAVAITPPDIILTRLYNQPLDDAGKGKYYRGVFDCFWKVLRAEGMHGLYKGFWPTYYRIAPHSTLVLLFYDEMKLLRDKL